MFYLVCLALCLFGNSLNASDIRIQIDTNDVLKLVGSLMSSDLIRKFANQMMQRTAIQYGSYHNPYHPEDNIGSNLDEAAANALIDANLEKENENFIPNAEEKNEDQLTEVEKPKTPLITDVEEKTTLNKNATKSLRNHPPLFRHDRFEDKEVKDDSKNTFQNNQRRYVVIGSN